MQQRLATRILSHGAFPLQYDELVATGRATALSPHDLKRRVLIKGKVRIAKDSEGQATMQTTSRPTTHPNDNGETAPKLNARWCSVQTAHDTMCHGASSQEVRESVAKGAG